MAGQIPFPGLCERCAVLGHGALPTSLNPSVIQVLHLEASYLCGLSCPQCIPAKLRCTLGSPPYNMSITMLRSIMEQLNSEGVASIQTIHFEGRGDPLSNYNLGALIQLSKQYFPAAVTMVTTHGCYPYKPWITNCDLDILRVSIDGALPKSYERYRVGGDLEMAFSFLRALRDERRDSHSAMNVIWKYLLFEWNDSDHEMQLAASVARELDCRLKFVLTHSPGRSTRFPDYSALKQHLQKMEVTATIEETYPLKIGAGGTEIEGTSAEYVESLLMAAYEQIRSSNLHGGVAYLCRALSHDPGLTRPNDYGEATIHMYLKEVLSAARFPLTLSWLAAIAHEWGDNETCAILLRRYLELAPDAPDRDHVLHDLSEQLSQISKPQS